ncbi:MAG: hypothetical protein MJZ77_03025 [Bacteroidales bacterium]|nr:hypothetical protein [Bacteroidales bacterium]
MRCHNLFPRPAYPLSLLFAVFYFLLFINGLQAKPAAPRPPLWGRVRVVTSHPQFRVRVVTSHPDIYILRTSRTPESVGQWQFVDAFEDFTVQFVDAFEDFSIQYVDAFPGIRSPFSRLRHLLASAIIPCGSDASSPASASSSLFTASPYRHHPSLPIHLQRHRAQNHHRTLSANMQCRLRDYRHTTAVTAHIPQPYCQYQ